MLSDDDVGGGGQEGIPQPPPHPGPQQGMPDMALDQNRLWQLQQQQQMAALRAAGLSQQQVMDLLRSRQPQQVMPPPFGMNQLGANGAPQLPPGVFPGSMTSAILSNSSDNMARENAFGMQGLPMGQNGMQDGFPPQRRSVSVQDMHEKAQLLQNAIQKGESRVKSLQTQPGPLTAEQLSAEITKAQRLVDERRHALSRIMTVLHTVSNCGVAGVVPGSMSSAMLSDLSVNMAQADALRTQSSLMEQDAMQDMHEEAQQSQSAIQQGESRVQPLQNQSGPLTAEQLCVEFTKLQMQVDDRSQAVSPIQDASHTVSQNGVHGASGLGGLMHNAQHSGTENPPNGMGGLDKPDAEDAPPAQSPQQMTSGPWITSQQTQAAFELVKRLRDEYKNVATSPRPQTMVPDDQRLEYNAAFENLCRSIGEVDQKLPYYAMFMKEEIIKKFIVMIHAVNLQRELLVGQAPPKYILDLDLVKVLVNQAIYASMMFKSWFIATNGASGRPSMVRQPGVGPSASGQFSPVPASASESASSMLQPPSH